MHSMHGDSCNYNGGPLETGLPAGAGEQPEMFPWAVGSLPATSLPAPSLFAVGVETGGRRCLVKVQLQAGDGLYQGVAAGPDSPRQRLRLAAAAAVQAVEELLGGAFPLAVEDVQEVALGARTAVVLTLALPADAGVDCLIGAALIHRDPIEAGARAVLDAVRRLPCRWEENHAFPERMPERADGESRSVPG